MKVGRLMRMISFHPIGDHGCMIDFGQAINVQTNRLILNWKKTIEKNPFRGFIEAIPAYTTLTVFYNPIEVGTDFPYRTVKNELQQLDVPLPQKQTHTKTVDIPVCYEKTFALDIDIVAEHNRLTVNEVIDLHSKPLYDVYFLGFSPGFPFLGGMDEQLSTPRKTTPRMRIPAGSVGIAGKQTGIYPQSSPGGWQIIGRTPFKLFQVDQDIPTMIEPGDTVRFIPISMEQYRAMEASI